MDSIIDGLYDTVADTYRAKTVGVSDLVTVALYAMQLAELHTELAGPEKKQVVERVVERLVAESGLLGAEEAPAAQTFLAATLPTLIDTFVAVAKTGGKLIGKKLLSCCG